LACSIGSFIEGFDVLYRKFGRTGLNVSRLCLGTMTFGLQTDESASRSILDRAADAGVNFIDTANVYAAR